MLLGQFLEAPRVVSTSRSLMVMRTSHRNRSETSRLSTTWPAITGRRAAGHNPQPLEFLAELRRPIL